MNLFSTSKFWIQICEGDGDGDGDGDGFGDGDGDDDDDGEFSSILLSLLWLSL